MVVCGESCVFFKLDMIPSLRAILVYGGNGGAKYSMHSPLVGTEHIVQGI